jgi:hypothetical protein
VVDRANALLAIAVRLQRELADSRQIVDRCAVRTP